MGFWDGFWDITGDVIEFTLPTVGTLLGPGGRALGGALGNLIDEAIDGDIHSFQDVAETMAWGAGEALLGGMVGGVVGKLVGKGVPGLRGMGTDSLNLGIGLGRPANWQLELVTRAGQVLANPREIGKGIGAGAGLLVADMIAGDTKPAPVRLPVRPLKDPTAA